MQDDWMLPRLFHTTSDEEPSNPMEIKNLKIEPGFLREREARKRQLAQPARSRADSASYRSLRFNELRNSARVSGWVRNTPIIRLVSIETPDL